MMKSGLTPCLFFGIIIIIFAQIGTSQITVPSKPGQVTKRDLSEKGGSGSSVGISGAGGVTASSPVVVHYVAVTPMEPWANLEGKVMQARLLAFSAPEAGQSGPVEIIRSGKVRFLVSGRKEPIDYPLEQLGEAERTKILALAEMAAKGAPAPE